MPDQQPPPPPSQLPIPAGQQALIQQFLQNQTQQLTIEQSRVAIEAKNAENAHVYAMKSLEVQAAEMECHRGAFGSHVNKRYWFLVFVLVLMCGMIVYCLQTGHSDLVWDFVKVMAGAAGGLGAGFAWGQNQAKKELAASAPPDQS